jgi:hypothetical protein
MSAAGLNDNQKRLLRLMMYVGWIAPTVLFVALVLLLPVDVFQRWPLLAELCTAVELTVKKVLPSIDLYRHARSTSFPQVAIAATSYSMVWWVAATATTVVLFLAVVASGSSLLRGQTRKSVAVFLLIGPVFVIGGPLAFFALAGDPSFARGLTTNSRLGYAFMGSAAVLMSAICAGGWPATFLSLFIKKSSREIHHG